MRSARRTLHTLGGLACAAAAVAACTTSSAATIESHNSSVLVPRTPAVDLLNKALTTPAAGSAKGKTFVYVASANGDTIYGAIACGAKTEAERLGATYKLDTIGPTYAAPPQISTLEAAAATKPSGIMISPMDPNALYTPISEVVSSGIPVATVDNQLTNPDKVISQVLVNNRASGVLAAEYFAKRAAGRKEKVALLTIPLGLDIASDDEDNGFIAELKKYPNLTYVGATYENVVLSDNVSGASAIFAKYPDLFGIFGTQQFADDGAVTAAKQLGVHPLVVAGYGGQDDALVTDLRNGTIAAMTDYPLAQVGARAIDELADKVEGHPVQKEPTFDAILRTKASLSQPGLVLGSKEAVC